MFENYLTNKKQCIGINQEDKTNLEIVKLGVLQGSILGPLLDICKWKTYLLNPIMFAEDINLFYSSKDIMSYFSQLRMSYKKYQSLFYYK